MPIVAQGIKEKSPEWASMRMGIEPYTFWKMHSSKIFRNARKSKYLFKGNGGSKDSLIDCLAAALSRLIVFWEIFFFNLVNQFSSGPTDQLPSPVLFWKIMSQICPVLDKMHSNEFINMPSAYKTRGFQRQNPLVGLMKIKFWAKKYKIQFREKNITATPSLGPQQRMPFQSSKASQNPFPTFLNFKTRFTT